jgi:hypothetical protein
MAQTRSAYRIHAIRRENAGFGDFGYCVDATEKHGQKSYQERNRGNQSAKTIIFS